MKTPAPRKTLLETKTNISNALKLAGIGGETVLQVWRPQYRLFLAQQSLIIIAIMLVVTAVVFFMGGTFLFPLFMLIGLAVWAFLLDQDDWRENRNKVWVLTDRHICRLSTDPMDETLVLGLTHINRVSDWGMWKLFLRTDDVKVIELAYVGRASVIASELNAAMRNNLPPMPNKGSE